MARKQRFKMEQVADALRRSGGVKSVAARALGCDRTTVHNYCLRYPELQAVADSQVEELLDVAEGNIRRTVYAGDLETSKWILRTRGRDRGYGDKQTLGVEQWGRFTLDLGRGEKDNS